MPRVPRRNSGAPISASSLRIWTESRLRHPQPFGGLADAARLGDGDEIAEPAKIHWHTENVWDGVQNRIGRRVNKTVILAVNAIGHGGRLRSDVTMNGDPCLLSATVLRGLIATKQISPVELVSAVLARAEAFQPELNCFITICGDEALAAAREAERKLMAGEPLGLLHGIPATVKDIVNTRGVTTSFGAVPYKDNVPNEDAVAVARLRAQGAILIGK